MAAGGYITDDGFSPVVGESYFYQNEKWLVNTFSSAELISSPNIELFFFFRPRISNQVKLFLQLIINSNFDFQQHNFSQQNLRVGLDYKSIQFGLGGDFYQEQVSGSVAPETSNTKFNLNIGVFYGKNFD